MSPAADPRPGAWQRPEINMAHVRTINDWRTAVRRRIEVFGHSLTPWTSKSYHFDGTKTASISTWTWCRDCKASLDLTLVLSDLSRGALRRGDLFVACPGWRRTLPEDAPKGYVIL